MENLSISNIFEILKLPEQYPLDLDTLEKAYQHAIARAHPDILKSPEQLTAATVNRAYTLAKDPVQRAHQLAALKFIPPLDLASVPPDVLRESFEHRETLSTLTTLESCTLFLTKIQTLVSQTIGEVADKFDEQHREPLCRAILTLTYLQKSAQEAQHKIWEWEDRA